MGAVEALLSCHGKISSSLWWNHGIYFNELDFFSNQFLSFLQLRLWPIIQIDKTNEFKYIFRGVLTRAVLEFDLKVFYYFL